MVPCGQQSSILFYFTGHAFSHRPPILPLFSFTIPKKKNRNKSQKSFLMKTSACRDGTLKNQPNKMGTTPQHFHIIPTSCAILPTMHTTTCTLAFSNQLNRRTSHSLPFSHQLASFPGAEEGEERECLVHTVCACA